jgi:hypothetical protein
LTVAVAEFKLPGQSMTAMIELFKQAHLAWVKRINDMLAGRVTLDDSQMDDHHGCILGKWYYKRGVADYGDEQAFIVIEKPHARIHEVLRSSVAAFNRGDRRAAEAGAKEVERLSHEIVNGLDRLERSIAA